MREKALASGFSFNMEETNHTCVCRRTKQPGWGVHGEQIRDKQH